MRNDPEYIAYLEQRIAALEGRLSAVEVRLPRTQLMSASFMSRAFAVLGHYMVASMIIAIPIYIFAFIFAAAIGSSLSH